MRKSIIIIMAAMLAFAVTSFAAPRKKVELKEVTFSVHLHCANCVKKVQENIAFEKGVKDLHVCLEDQIVYIKYDAAKTSEETLKKAIEKLGYPVAGVVEAGCNCGHDHGHKAEQGHNHGHNHDHGHDHAH
jgi:copper chaperone CopZ